MIKNDNIKGHIFALFTVLIWGITFVSTKVILKALSPIEIIIYRYVIGYICLWAMYPKKIEFMGFRQELPFILCGILGTSLYQSMENIALTYTQASNVSIIISCIPFFTGILAKFVFGEKIRKSFVVGFIIAIAGIILVNINGSVILKLNPLGDLLALIAALFWAMYTIVINFVNKKNINVLGATRRIFFYGVLSTIPLMFFGDFSLNSIYELKNPEIILNVLFLGIAASSVCFVTWNYAVKKIGSVKTSIYNYLNPVVTLIFSIIILDEKLGVLGFLGIILVILGLIISSGLKK